MKGKKSKQPKSTSLLRSERPKNSTNTSSHDSYLFFNRYRLNRQFVFYTFYLVVWLLVSYLFFKRFPNNFREPNFYAEDGNLFAQGIITHGTAHSLLTTFNGYYIWGIYLLEKLGFVINSIFFHNEFVNLARSFALVSYGFLGFLATLPILLFRNYLRPMAIILLVVLALYVPMPSYDYAVIGTIGNLKFAFIYLAFLLIIYRHIVPRSSKKIHLVDLGLLICAYTNVTVYPMLLFSLVRYIPLLKGRDFYKKLLKDRSFQSLLVLGLALIPQLLVVAIKGVPVLKGYLDNPFNFKRTIEVFISRSYTYSILFPINKHLNDGLVIVATLIFLVAGWFFAKRYRSVFLFGLLTIFASTFLFVIKRTGVSDFYTGYHSSGPDQFFYAQNWVFDFLAALVLGGLLSRIRSQLLRYGSFLVVFLGIIFILGPRASTYGKNTIMESTVGNIYTVAKHTCSSDNHQLLTIPIYPSVPLVYHNVGRSTLCTKTVLNYHYPKISLGLAPYDNDYIAGLGSQHTFTQTFTSPEANLSGLSVYFSTFLTTVKNPYSLTLYDAGCKQTIFTQELSIKHIADNAFYSIPIKKQSDSQNKTYCFSITSDTKNDTGLAIQLSKPGVYKTGVLSLDNKLVERDVVFELNYSQ